VFVAVLTKSSMLAVLHGDLYPRPIQSKCSFYFFVAGVVVGAVVGAVIGAVVVMAVTGVVLCVIWLIRCRPKKRASAAEPDEWLRDVGRHEAGKRSSYVTARTALTQSTHVLVRR
jgi:hypothetical protein